jgi:nucleotide-binding universal stress UspA family protein
MIRSVVVGTDGSGTATEAVRQAADLAVTHGALIHLVTVVPSGRDLTASQIKNLPDNEQAADAVLSAAAAIFAGLGVTYETHHRTGDPAEAIIEVAQATGADLIMVGNKGMSGAKRFLLGSVPNKIAHHAPCNVMIVKTH